MKKIGLIVLAFTIMMPLLATLHVYFDANRFLDNSGVTVTEINYKIPYKDLVFTRTDAGFVASVTITLQLQKQGQTVHAFDPMPVQIVVENEDMTTTDNGYLDKIVLPMKRDGYDINVIVNEPASEQTVSQIIPLPLLAPDALSSDLELSSDVVADTSSYRARFIRGGARFDVEPHHIFDSAQDKAIFMYYELRNFMLDDQGRSNISESIVIMRNGEEVQSLDGSITKASSVIARIKEIPIVDLEAGLYDVIMVVSDNISGKSMQVQDYFSVVEHSGRLVRMLNDDEKEFMLIKYFLHDIKGSMWDSLSETGKLNFINRFWTSRDPDPSTSTNEFYDEIKDRMAYANQHFAFFKDGWETDRGRIYLKYGAPAEIKKGETEFTMESQSRDYIIWKYEGSRMTSYVFMDSQATGNFRLIYSGKDETETTQPNYEDLLGENFDYYQLD